jgi:hypothetical protein
MSLLMSCEKLRNFQNEVKKYDRNYVLNNLFLNHFFNYLFLKKSLFTVFYDFRLELDRVNS